MKISSIGIGVVSAALLCGQARAAETDYAAGTRALPLQQAGGTARAMAMGSAVVAVSQGSSSLLWNPAGLGRIRCTEIGLHHNTGLGDTIQETAIIGFPLGEAKPGCIGGTMGGIAASYGYVDYGSFGGRDSIGLPTADYYAGDYSASLGWGMEMLPGFSGGIALKVNQSNFDKIYNSFAADVGVLWTVMPALDLGLAYTNISLGDNIDIGELISGLRLGAAWTVDKHLILAASGELQNKAMDRFQLGAEYLIGNTESKINVLALRAGFQVNYPDPQLSGLTDLTLGLGYTLTRSMALDYAMVPAGELGTSHKLSLTFRFKCPRKPQKPVIVAIIIPPAPAAIVAAEPQKAPEPIVLKSILLEDSYFAFDSSALKPRGMDALRENIQLLKDNPKAQVRVAGYTSMMGTEEYNQLLSERRAKAVEEFLVTEGGIAPDRISTIGYGETQPATHEATPGIYNTDAAKSNMRVLSTVTEKQ